MIMRDLGLLIISQGSYLTFCDTQLAENKAKG